MNETYYSTDRTKERPRRLSARSIRNSPGHSIQNSPRTIKSGILRAEDVDPYKKLGADVQAHNTQRRSHAQSFYASKDKPPMLINPPSRKSDLSSVQQLPPAGLHADGTADKILKRTATARLAKHHRSCIQNDTPHKNDQGAGKLYDLETESKFINKNLTTLGRIFGILSNWRNEQQNVLASNKKGGKGKGVTMAVPYRECKLTRLLQNSLQFGNKCRTLMIITVCGTAANHQQTKETLEFGERAAVAF